MERMWLGFHERRRSEPLSCSRSTSQILIGVEIFVAETSKVPTSGACVSENATPTARSASEAERATGYRSTVAYSSVNFLRPRALHPRQSRAVQGPRGESRVLRAGDAVLVLALVEQRQPPVAIRERDGAALLWAPAEHQARHRLLVDELAHRFPEYLEANDVHMLTLGGFLDIARAGAEGVLAAQPAGAAIGGAGGAGAELQVLDLLLDLDRDPFHAGHQTIRLVRPVFLGPVGLHVERLHCATRDCNP